MGKSKAQKAKSKNLEKARLNKGQQREGRGVYLGVSSEFFQVPGASKRARTISFENPEDLDDQCSKCHDFITHNQEALHDDDDDHFSLHEEAIHDDHFLTSDDEDHVSSEEDSPDSSYDEFGASDFDDSNDEDWHEEDLFGQHAELSDDEEDFEASQLSDIEDTDPSKPSYQQISVRARNKRKLVFFKWMEQEMPKWMKKGKKIIGDQLETQKVFEKYLSKHHLEAMSKYFTRTSRYQPEWINWIIQKFKQCPRKTHNRVVIVSKIFDDLGNLLFFRTMREAYRALDCCLKTLYKARKHAIVFGPGFPLFKQKKNRKDLSHLLTELQCWAETQMILRISSFETTSEGKPVSYLTDTIGELWKQYLADDALEQRVGRTLFFRFFSQNRFRRMTLMGGLCTVCDGSGYAVRQNIIDLAQRFCPQREKALRSSVDHWIRHIRRTTLPSAEHLPCTSHCYTHSIGHTCPLIHSFECEACLKIFEIIKDFQEIVEANVPNKNDLYRVKVEDLPRAAKAFVAHRMRTASTQKKHNEALRKINESHALIILDFKQKLIKEQFRESQANFFGKSAFASLHGAAVLTQQTEAQRLALIQQVDGEKAEVKYHYIKQKSNRNNESDTTIQRQKIPVNIEFVDVYSSDTQQDSMWVNNVLELIACHLKTNTPNIKTVELWCDNASCYHNNEVARFAPVIFHLKELYLQSVTFFEPGEGKSLLDRHFASVRHAITRRLADGKLFDHLDHVGEVLAALNGVHCYSLTPNRETLGIDASKINEISHLHDWRYEYGATGVVIKMFKEVERNDDVSPAHTESRPYLAQSSGENGEGCLAITKGTFVAESGAKRVLPPLTDPLKLSMSLSDLTSLKPLTVRGADLFVPGWGAHKACQKQRQRFAPHVVKSLRYFFHMGNLETETLTKKTLSHKFICHKIADFIREGKIEGRAITEQQTRAWLSSEKRRNRPAPEWFNPGQETCIWSSDQQESPEDEPEDEEEREQDMRLRLRFPSHLWLRTHEAQRDMNQE